MMIDYLATITLLRCCLNEVYMATYRKNIQRSSEHWLNEKWRPMMGWMYMAICTFDFIVAPILWSLLQARDHGMIATQWQPLTLQGAGLFHLAMGAILGITAYGRTQEKINLPTTPTPLISTNLNLGVPSTPAITNVAGKKAPIPLDDPML